MEKEIIIKMIEMINKISPELWESLILQQYLMAYGSIALLILSIISLMFGISVLKKRPAWAMDSYNDNMIGQAITIVSIILVIAFTISFFLCTLPTLINPMGSAIVSLKP